MNNVSQVDTNFFKLTAKSTMPPAKLQWNVALGNDPKDVLIYTNLAYDLCAIAMAKLGIAMSEHVLGDDTKMNALSAETKAGRVE